MTKIEPVAWRFSNRDLVTGNLFRYEFQVSKPKNPYHPNYTCLFTEAQMRQLGEACAAIIEFAEMPKVVHGAHPDYIEGKAMQCVIGAHAIRELIKEMLG